MIGKLKEAAEAARLRVGVWNRERKEKAEERKAERADPPGVTVPAWLVRSAHFAGWIAYCALMYFLWERVLDVSEAQHSTLEVTHFGIWSNLNLAIFFPLIVGYFFVVIGVPYVAKIAIPILVSLSWRDAFWPKLTALIITILVSVVLITGTATVGSNAIIESERSAAVAVEQVQTGRAVLESRITSREAELRSMMENRNAYLAQAASVGAAEWQRSYIDQTAANDPQRERIVRALGAARSADAVRADIQTLREQLATSQAVAAVSSEVITPRTQTLSSVMDALNTFWVLMLAVVMDLACLFMPWIAMRLEQTRNAQLARMSGVEGSGWAPRSHRIEDLRGESVVDSEGRVKVPEPPTPIKRRYTDADTGDEIEEQLIKPKQPKPYKRERVIKKGEKFQVEIKPDIPPDETGAQDGGNRTASVTIGGLMDSLAPEHNVSFERDATADTGNAEVETVHQPTEHIAVEMPDQPTDRAPESNAQAAVELNSVAQDDLSEEFLPPYAGEDETNTEPQDAEIVESVQEENAEPDQQREPETDPSRLIAAE